MIVTPRISWTRHASPHCAGRADEARGVNTSTFLMVDFLMVGARGGEAARSRAGSRRLRKSSCEANHQRSEFRSSFQKTPHSPNAAEKSQSMFKNAAGKKINCLATMTVLAAQPGVNVSRLLTT